MSRWRSVRAVAAVGAAAAALLVAGCAPAPGGGGGAAGVGPHSVEPSVTDPAISPSPLSPQFFVRPSGTPRGELAVLFNGTGAGPYALSKMGTALSQEGFHVIGLRYDSALGTLGGCPDSVASTFPDCHRQFRGEIVFGEGLPDPDAATYDHPSLSVTAADSVMNRLVKFVEYLHVQYPTEGWDQFQQRTAGVCDQAHPQHGACDLDWSTIVPMGHSQGAGVALFLGKHFAVPRLGMLSGPYDAFYDGVSSYDVAPWVAEGGFQVPIFEVRTFSHLSDPAIPIHRAVSDELALAGPEVNVTVDPRPYGGTQRLVSDATPGCLFDSAPSHNSTATDLCSTSSSHPPAWRYLATGS